MNLDTIISPSLNFLSNSSLLLPMHTLADMDFFPMPTPFNRTFPTVWTLIKFVVPLTPTGIPAVITIRSPSLYSLLPWLN